MLAFLRRARRMGGVMWLAFNQLLNSTTGGDSNMTVSARAAYAREHGSKAAERLCKVLDVLDVTSSDLGDHCDTAKVHYERRLQASLDKAKEAGK